MNDSTPEEIIHLVTRFNNALNRHAVDAMMQCMTADCVFENTCLT
jgi:ketosteroid isomerase-like protein